MLKFYIPHRKKDEKIILLLRRHWLIIVSKIFFWGLVSLMPLVLFAIKGSFAELAQGQFFAPIAALFLSIYYLYVWLFAFHSFLDYYLDVWIVTSHRIINIEQRGLFARTISEQKLSRVQDVTSEVKGIFATMLNFGTVFIQTAGEEPRFIFKQIPEPDHVARKVVELSEKRRRYEEIISGKDKIHIK